MTIVVYLGPTMRVDDAREILPDAIYLPPAGQSDILSAVDQYSPTAIALIDGVFTQSLSVWHKEILYALERGVAVYGASSMGALRVAETAAFGAVGVGSIYEAFARGELTQDDEVAVAHATAEGEFRAMSDAMVNIRATLAGCVEAGVIDPTEHDRLIILAKSRFFPERSYHALLEDAAGHGFPSDTLDRLRQHLRQHRVDAKRDDAVALLERLRDLEVTPPPPARVTRSHPFDAMYHRDRRITRRGVQVSRADISSYAALHLPDFGQVSEQALHAGLVDVLAEMLHVEPDDAQIEAETQRFRADRRLRSDADLAQWQADNDVNEEDFAALIRRQAVRRILRDWLISRKYLERTTEEVLDELRLQGRYHHVADAAAHQQAVLDSDHPDLAYQGSDTPLIDLVREHSHAARWRPTVPLDQWAFENGFKDVYDVRFELVRAQRARQAMARVAASLTDMIPEPTGQEPSAPGGSQQ